MAKVTAPLLSFGASGTLAKTMVFSKWKGRPYARRHVIPANPQTVGQSLTRDSFSKANSFWKTAPTLFVSPWDRFAAGQVLTGRNAYVGRYVSELRALGNLQTMTFSPGAKGGLAPLTIVTVAGVGTIQVDTTVPSPPSGWTLDGVTAAALVDGDPQDITEFAITALEDLAAPYSSVLTGLQTGVLYVVATWTRWSKPDGSVAYGPDIATTETPT